MISRDSSVGYLLRSVHSNGAAILFAVIYLHMGRALVRGTHGRARVWAVGVLIYVLAIGTCFTGYSLVYGQMSMWAIVVICSLVTATPIIGTDLLTLVWGGSSVSAATLGRLFTIHYLLALVIALLALAHLWLLHDVGSTGSRDVGSLPRSDRLDFNHAYIIRDVSMGLAIITILGVISTQYSNAMGEADNFQHANPMVTPPCISPEWYMMPYYGLVRAIPSKVVGIAAMGIAFTALANVGDSGFKSSSMSRVQLSLLALALLDVVLLCKVCLKVTGETLYCLLLTSVLGVAACQLVSSDKLTTYCSLSNKRNT
jgi:ubiquinol-cytochrome c reductase cytochrome b subunit